MKNAPEIINLVNNTASKILSDWEKSLERIGGLTKSKRSIGHNIYSPVFLTKSYSDRVEVSFASKNGVNGLWFRLGEVSDTINVFKISGTRFSELRTNIPLVDINGDYINSILEAYKPDHIE